MSTVRMVAGVMWAALLAAEARGQTAPKPNVLVLFSDDQRTDTIHALGNSRIRTPNLDELVGRGLTFTHAFCMGATRAGGLCAPSRSMLMTGRTLFRSLPEIPANLPLWPIVMRQAGYETFATGKWHNERATFARAFSTGADAIFFGGMGDHRKMPVSGFDPSGRYEAGAAHLADVFSSELFAGAAIDFLRHRQKDRPFFLYVAFTAPHDPRIPPGEYARMYDPKDMLLPASYMPAHPFDNGDLDNRDERLLPWPRTPEAVRQEIANYYGMISHLDAQIGRILRTLDETDVTRNTLVIFASDNGLALGAHGLLGKENLYDYSLRIPLIVAGPGVRRSRRSDALCYQMDLFPTVCELAGIPVPATVEGKSLAGIIRGQQKAVRNSAFGAYGDVQRMVRTQRWKLIHYPKIGKTQLFAIDRDPDEVHDLSAEPGRSKLIQKMMALLIEWQRKLNDTILPATGDSNGAKRAP